MKPDAAAIERECLCKPSEGVLRLLLSEAASKALTEAGSDAFTIVHRAMRGTEEPDSAGRWCIHLAPVSHQAASDACEVLLGRKKAIKPRKPRP